jgi:hypothetical protein
MSDTPASLAFPRAGHSITSSACGQQVRHVEAERLGDLEINRAHIWSEAPEDLTRSRVFCASC